MPVRVSPTDRIPHHINELFAQDHPLPEILEEVARLGAQLLMQAALETEAPSSSAATVTSVPSPESTVSAIRSQIKDEHQTRAEGRLGNITVDYPALDASFSRMHPGSPTVPVLAAWGITTSSKPAFIGLAPGTGESAEAWTAFLSALKDRGLASPLLVRCPHTSAGSPTAAKLGTSPQVTR